MTTRPWLVVEPPIRNKNHLPVPIFPNYQKAKIIQKKTIESTDNLGNDFGMLRTRKKN